MLSEDSDDNIWEKSDHKDQESVQPDTWMGEDVIIDPRNIGVKGNGGHDGGIVTSSKKVKYTYIYPYGIICQCDPYVSKYGENDSNDERRVPRSRLKPQFEVD